MHSVGELAHRPNASRAVALKISWTQADTVAAFALCDLWAGHSASFNGRKDLWAGHSATFNGMEAACTSRSASFTVALLRWASVEDPRMLAIHVIRKWVADLLHSAVTTMDQ